MRIRIIRVNDDGWKLVNNGQFWSIRKQLADGSFHVRHVGNRNHVVRMWNERFCKRIERDPTTGVRVVVGVDSSLRV